MKQGGLWVCVSKTVCGFLGCMCIKKKKDEGGVHMEQVGLWCMNEQEIVLTYSQPTTEQHKLQGPIGGKRKPN